MTTLTFPCSIRNSNLFMDDSIEHMLYYDVVSDIREMHLLQKESMCAEPLDRCVDDMDDDDFEDYGLIESATVHG